jgi:hypothetical protein
MTKPVHIMSKAEMQQRLWHLRRTIAQIRESIAEKVAKIDEDELSLDALEKMIEAMPDD